MQRGDEKKREEEERGEWVGGGEREGVKGREGEFNFKII